MTSSETTFNDEELIARLRDAVSGEHDMTPHGADVLQAADRIEQLAVTNEQLVATNEALTEQLAAARKDVDEVEAYAWELEQRLPTSEKLAAYRATIEETSSHNKGENHD